MNNGESVWKMPIVNCLSLALFFVFLSPCVCTLLLSDPAAVECEQYDLAVLADTLRAYLQELPCPIIPSVLYSELAYTAQGKLAYRDKLTPLCSWWKHGLRMLHIALFFFWVFPVWDRHNRLPDYGTGFMLDALPRRNPDILPRLGTGTDS